jgi:hypothetical protein
MSFGAKSPSNGPLYDVKARWYSQLFSPLVLTPSQPRVLGHALQHYSCRREADEGPYTRRCSRAFFAKVLLRVPDASPSRLAGNGLACFRQLPKMPYNHTLFHCYDVWSAAYCPPIRPSHRVARDGVVPLFLRHDTGGEAGGASFAHAS